MSRSNGVTLKPRQSAPARARVVEAELVPLGGCLCGCVVDPSPQHGFPADTSWHDGFLGSMATMPNVRAACLAAGVSRPLAYLHRDHYPGFKAAWDVAAEDGIDHMEQEAWKRAKDASDRLMELMLRAHRPEKFGAKVAMEHSGPGGGPIESRTTIDASKLSTETLKRLKEELGE